MTQSLTARGQKWKRTQMCFYFPSSLGSLIVAWGGGGGRSREKESLYNAGLALGQEKMVPCKVQRSSPHPAMSEFLSFG